jgi:hypothetical protein
MPAALDVSIRGRSTAVPVIAVCGVNVIVAGRLLRKGEVFDEYWLERKALPSPESVIAELQHRTDRPDLFTFAQRIPDTEPRYGYRYELDNYAVLPLSTYERWFEEQIPAATRRNIRAAQKRGIEVRVSAYDEGYVRGIMSIYNESPVRAGRKFWHFGKDFDTVKRENGTYAERSTYLGAYRDDEMVGYLKVVWDQETAAIMQILSKLACRDFRPNNALLAEAVKLCASRGVRHLLYEKFDYGRKAGDSLTRFKQNNGFVRMDVPRYFVPLTRKGEAGLQMGLHRRLMERLPEWLVAPMRDLRTRWYERAVERT